jgi:excisionase family DNA binding protein
MATMIDAADGRTVGPEPRPDVSAQLLDLKAVAILLGGCSRRHIVRLADANRMPRPIRLGSLVRWRRAELEAWIDAGCPSQQPAGRRP